MGYLHLWKLPYLYYIFQKIGMCFCFSDLKPPETAWLAAGEWLVFFVYFPLRPVVFLPPTEEVLKSELVLSILLVARNLFGTYTCQKVFNSQIGFPKCH